MHFTGNKRRAQTNSTVQAQNDGHNNIGQTSQTYRLNAQMRVCMLWCAERPLSGALARRSHILSGSHRPLRPYVQ